MMSVFNSQMAQKQWAGRQTDKKKEGKKAGRKEKRGEEQDEEQRVGEKEESERGGDKMLKKDTGEFCYPENVSIKAEIISEQRNVQSIWTLDTWKGIHKSTWSQKRTQHKMYILTINKQKGKHIPQIQV